MRRAEAAQQVIKNRMAKLTPRERQVLALVVNGKLNKQIAFDLGTVEKTIKFHRSSIMRKLEVRTALELVRMAEKAGLPSFGIPATLALRPARHLETPAPDWPPYDTLPPLDRDRGR